MASTSLTPYRVVLGVPAARQVLATGVVIRVPIFATAVVLTLHVVTHLHHSYSAAGLVAAVATLGLAISAPWRGRRLDRVGVRRTIAPSLVVLSAGWTVLPHLGYWPLLVGVGLVNLFEVPTFSVVRQALVHAVPDGQRRSALALDSVLVELSFMIGPAVGVLMATYLPTPLALQLCAYATVAGAIGLWWQNPQLRADPLDAEPAVPEGAETGSAELVAAAPANSWNPGWLTAPVVAVLIISAAATIMLTGSDVGAVAALRQMHHQAWIGWELTVWGLGSAIGGIVYGALPRAVPLPVLIAALGGSTLLVAAAQGPVSLAVLLFVAGCFCAPTIAASIEALTRGVPPGARGEALGWHGSALTVGSALGAPLGGASIDRFGWRGGYTATALALVLGLAVTPLLRRHDATPRVAPEPAAQPVGSVAADRR